MDKKHAIRLKNENADRLMDHREVTGVGVGGDDDRPGQYLIAVYLLEDETPGLRRRVEEVLGHDTPFKLITTGEFTLLPVGPRPSAH